MDINDEQIEFIREDLYRRGVKLNSLAESLLDHICCAIEHHSGNHFETVYEEILERFGQDGILRIQKETSLLINSKKEAIMKKVMFSLGYIAASLITTGTLFKIQHWPMASIMLVLGIAILNLGFLPLYFIDRYKKSMAS